LRRIEHNSINEEWMMATQFGRTSDFDRFIREWRIRSAFLDLHF